MQIQKNILSSDFYLQPTKNVARDLLGKILVVKDENGQRLSGRIVETEAYVGVEDRACHAFGGRQTKRVRSMYLAGGHAYVYFVYGLHFCFNVVTQKEGVPEAVLIRALEPLEGLPIMHRRRQTSSVQQLTSGPAKLCEALGIDRSWDGHFLGSQELRIEEGPSPEKRHIRSSPRIGVSYAGEAALWPLRFFVCGNPWVSRNYKRS